MIGEVEVKSDFNSYESKYVSANDAKIIIPANISTDTHEKVTELAYKVYKTLYCRGLGRVDIFVKNNGSLVVNEINTLPGFTIHSMYPRLWMESSRSYSDIIDLLINLALKNEN